MCKKNTIKLLLKLILVLIFLLEIRDSGAQDKTIVFTFENNKKIYVEISKKKEEMAKGLMYRQSLPEDSGMLFIFDKPMYPVFWMKNCFISLDIIWLDEKKVIVDFKENVPPCLKDPCPIYTTSHLSQYVLETNAGFIQKEKIQPGMKTDFSFDK